MITVARRELAAYFRSPVSYLVLTLFLLVEGYSFWLFVELLNGRATPHGAVLQYFFGGTFLYWLFLMFIVSVVTMRLIAEERRTNTIEPLLTAPVTDAGVVLGKFLGALGFYAALWAPTVLYIFLLAHYAPERPDTGPVLTGYLGTLLVGASALSLGLLASSLTRNQILAAVLSFVGLTLLLLTGAMGDALIRSGPFVPVLRHVNLFRHMEDFGRGILDTRHVVYHLGLIAIALFAATRLLRARDLRRFAAELAVLVAIVVAANYLAARHYARADLTRGHTYELSDKTAATIRALPRPVDLIVFMVPSGAEANDLYADVRELLDRAHRLAPDKLNVEFVDIDREPERLKTVGKRYGVSGDDLVNGVIVVASGEQSKFITRDELAEYDYATGDDARAPQLKAWKGEQALASALLAVTEERARLACFTQGSGEPSIESYDPAGYSDFAEELKRDHWRVLGFDLAAAGGVPRDCDVVIVAGPERPLARGDVDVLTAYLQQGGRLLALLGPTFDDKITRFVDTGLETPLERFGASLRNDIVVDEPRLRGNAIAFIVTNGYADHPITRPLHGKRTLWSDVREVRAHGPNARELVQTSDQGWGETDLGVFRAEAQLAFDPARDVKGPISIAVAAEQGATRLVVLGSFEFATNRTLQSGAFNRDLLLSSLAWLVKAEPRIAIGPRAVEHVRLTLDASQLMHIFLICVVFLPLGALLGGAGVFWARRR